MSNSIRFLGLAVFAWAGVRAASLGLLPGTEPIATSATAGTLPEGTGIPPIVPTRFEPPAPVAEAYPPQAYYAAYGGPPAPYARPMALPYYYPIPAPMPQSRPEPRIRGAGWAGIGASPEPLYYGPMGPDPWPVGPAPSGLQSSRPAAEPFAAAPKPPRFDRLQLSAWALLRGSPGPGSLATGGALGGSQAGARLTYRFSPALAASLRSSSSAGGVRGAEVAAGVRWQPMQSIPITFTAERREGLGRFGGRSAFALFAEGGLYQRPLFAGFQLDAYAQGGVVGARQRDLFFDGGATVTRPVWRNFSAGFGVWGGVQPGLYRVDAGPRVSLAVRRGIRLHADYRQRLTGNALPDSGPALTIAADF